jgi:hypothetical protein
MVKVENEIKTNYLTWLKKKQLWRYEPHLTVISSSIQVETM